MLEGRFVPVEQKSSHVWLLPLLQELQLVGQEVVTLAWVQISFPSALYGLCISFQVCV